MESFIESFQQFLDPQQIIQTGGLFLILIIIFAENGLFFGFFLPGDTLLFTTGLLCATNKFDIPLYVLMISICLVSYLGSLAGYFFGKKTGEELFKRNDSLFFKKKYLFAAEAFFNRHGGFALIMGRFLPIIRTFAPIFAGMVNFDFKKFLIFNVLGGTLWVVSLLGSGYFLGKILPNADKYLEYIILCIVVITWIPVIITYLKERKRRKEAEKQSEFVEK